MKDRFQNPSLQCFGLRNLIPKNALSEEINFETKLEQFVKATEHFSPNLSQKNNLFKVRLRGEFLLWIDKWQRETKKYLPEKTLDLISSCDEDFFPTIKCLLKILATLPISVASAARPFSTLRRVKTWLRSRMTELRLSALCLLYVHKDIYLPIDKIIERFAKGKSRRLNFII